MAKYTEWYAVELDGYLKGRLPDVQRFEATKEITNHFAEHVHDLVEKGMDPVEAEKAAIKSFGHPRTAAVNLLSSGRRSMVGSGLFTLAALGFLVSIVVSAVGFQFLSLKLDSEVRQNLLVTGACMFGGAGLCSMLAGFLSRKVQLAKLVTGWALGILASFGYLMLGPERHFSNIEPANMASQEAKWQASYDTTVKLSKLEEKLSAAVSLDNPYYRNYKDPSETIDRAAAIEKIKTLAPQMLAMNSPFVRATGTLTEGYLVPKRMISSYTYGSIRRYGLGGWQESLVSVTGESFPWTSIELKYVKTGDEAIQGWQNYRSNGWNFDQITREQYGYLAEAKKTSKMSRGALALSAISLLPVASLLYLAIFAVLSWIVGRVPDLTVYATFRRKLA